MSESSPSAATVSVGPVRTPDQPILSALERSDIATRGRTPPRSEDRPVSDITTGGLTPPRSDNAADDATPPPQGEACPPPLAWQEVLNAYRTESQSWELNCGPRRLTGRTWGEGPPLYLLNGFVATAEMYALLIYLLRDSFRCVVFDTTTMPGSRRVRPTVLGMRRSICLHRHLERRWPCRRHWIGRTGSQAWHCSMGSLAASWPGRNGSWPGGAGVRTVRWQRCRGDVECRNSTIGAGFPPSTELDSSS